MNTPEQNRCDEFVSRHRTGILASVAISTALALEIENAVPIISAPIALVRQVIGF